MPSSSKNKTRKSKNKRYKNKTRQRPLRVQLHNNFRKMIIMAFRGQGILNDTIGKFKAHQAASGIALSDKLTEELEYAQRTVANAIVECDKIATHGRNITEKNGNEAVWEFEHSDETMIMFGELEKYNGVIADVVEKTLITLEDYIHGSTNETKEDI